MVSTRKTSTAAAEPNTPQPGPTPSSAPTSSLISASIKSVTLDGWWLIKSQGKALAVEGFAFQEKAAARIFSSAAISKRHTATVLETIDGITVTVCGLLDISRTSQNGFPPKVYNHYLVGFPFDWEGHADGILGEGSTKKSAVARNTSSQKFNTSSQESNPSPFSIDDSQATVTRHYITSCLGESGDCSTLRTTFADILGTSGRNAFGDTTPPLNSNMQHPVETVKSVCDETHTNAKKVMVDDDRSKNTEECLEGNQKSKMRRHSTKNHTGGRLAATRSSARLKNSKTTFKGMC